MPNPANETVTYPFTAFNFAVEISITDGSPLVCHAAFSECDGLEMTLEPKTIREGGNNGRQIRLTGPVAYGQLTLKRGMTGFISLSPSAALSGKSESAIRPVTIRRGYVFMRCLFR